MNDGEDAENEADTPADIQTQENVPQMRADSARAHLQLTGDLFVAAIAEN